MQAPSNLQFCAHCDRWWCSDGPCPDCQGQGFEVAPSPQDAEPVAQMTLPFPPSVNTYWRRVGNKTLISARGRAYRKAAIALLRARPSATLLGPLRLEVAAQAPDRRVRDLDNLLKSLLDALQHGGTYQDDSQIVDLHIFWAPPMTPRGCVTVRLWKVRDHASTT